MSGATYQREDQARRRVPDVPFHQHLDQPSLRPSAASAGAQSGETPAGARQSAYDSVPVSTRYDVSQVPLQGGYVATRCPVRAQFDALRPCEPRPPSAAAERRMARGRTFETGIVARLMELHPTALMVSGDTPEEREAATIEAVGAGADLIIAGRLPADLVGRRVGEPDLLVRSRAGGYRPVDVKHHLTLQPLDGAGALCSELANVSFEAAAVDVEMSSRKRRDDLLQLAHYRTMLEVAKLGGGDRWGGISPSALKAKYPGAWAWLQKHRGDLRARSGTWNSANWYAYSRRQNLELFDRPKVLIPYMVEDLCAHFDPGNHFFVNVSTGGYGIPAANLEDPMYLTALLSSRLLSWVLARRSRTWRGGWFAARKGNLVRLPIAVGDGMTRKELIAGYKTCAQARAELVAARTDRSRELASRFLATAVANFDDAVEALYELSQKDRKLLRVG
jgi:hypothetical protein